MPTRLPPIARRRTLLCAGALAIAGTAVLAATTGPAPAAGPPRAARLPAERNCFWQLQNGRGEELACDHMVWLTPDERRDLAGVTRGLVSDASCIITVRLKRALVDAALANADHVFEAPPQRVTCNIETRGSVMPISGTFAPRVVLKGGTAVEATAGLGNVEGVHRALAWPVVEYVNRAPRIRNGMLAMINAYLGRRSAAR